MEIEELERSVSRHQAAIERIGNETRANTVHIADLQGRIDQFESWVERLERSMDRVANSNDALAERLTAMAEKAHEENEQSLIAAANNKAALNEHLIEYAKSEAKVARQAWHIWIASAVAVAGWVSAVTLAFASGILTR